jgi:hypothetical protein
MEALLNITSLGNMNRQFLSLLRSEQESHAPVIGDPRTFSKLLGENAKLTTLDEAFAKRYEELLSKGIPSRRFPYWFTIQLVIYNPKIILPGLKLAWEILMSFAEQQLGWQNGKESSVISLLQGNELIESQQQQQQQKAVIAAAKGGGGDGTKTVVAVEKKKSSEKSSDIKLDA